MGAEVEVAEEVVVAEEELVEGMAALVVALAEYWTVQAVLPAITG